MKRLAGLPACKQVRQLDLAPETGAFRGMKSTVWMVSAVVLITASGAALSVAQPISQDPQNRGPTPTLETYVVSGAPVEADRRSPDAPIEDGPVDIPQDAPMEWTPEASPETAAEVPYRPARQKARKVLRDVEGLNAEYSAYGDPAAEAQGAVAANQRRARAIDPIKQTNLTRLARILGSLHALRVSCSGREDQTYRSRMATLLDLEAPDTSALRDPLVDAFNAGFQAYGQGTATCPADRSTQEARLAKDGFGLAKQMAASYRPVVAPPADQTKQPDSKLSK